MKVVRIPAVLLIGAAVWMMVGLGATNASGDEHEETPQGAQAEALARTVQSAVRTTRTGAFRLVVVGTASGTYVETFGELEEEQAVVLARKLRALADLLVETEEHLCEEEEFDEEDEHEEHDEEDDGEEEEDDDFGVSTADGLDNDGE